MPTPISCHRFCRQMKYPHVPLVYPPPSTEIHAQIASPSKVPQDLQSGVPVMRSRVVRLTSDRSQSISDLRPCHRGDPRQRPDKMTKRSIKAFFRNIFCPNGQTLRLGCSARRGHIKMLLQFANAHLLMNPKRTGLSVRNKNETIVA